MKLLLASGGYDSALIGAQHGPWDLKVYFDYGQKWGDEEKKRLGEEVRLFRIPRLRIHENGFVPGRNLMFLVVIASEFPDSTVYFGSNAEDIFPDNNPQFLKKAARIVNIAFSANLKVVCPLACMKKKQIVAECKRLGLKCYSCYAGTPEPCGKCKACKQLGL